MGRLVAILLALTSVLGVSCARADQDDGRLVILFGELQRTADAAAAEKLTEQIWNIWHETEDDEARELLTRGITAMVQESYQDALLAFDGLVRLKPDFAEGWNKRATVYYLVGDYVASIRDVQQTLALEPRHFGALSGLGLIYMALGRDGEALSAFEAALAVNPHLPGPLQHVRELKERIEGKGI